MKNQNQAKGKSAKLTPIAPAQNTETHAPLPVSASRWSPMAVLAGNPFSGRDHFEIELDWIGDTMEPEVYQGNLARVVKRPDMWPCLGELVLGLLKNGSLVFGAFGTPEDDALIRVAFINPKHPSVYYRETDFQWLYSIDLISQLDETKTYRRIMKRIEFEAGDDPRLVNAASRV
jgi:hypothetical protein